MRRGQSQLSWRHAASRVVASRHPPFRAREGTSRHRGKGADPGKARLPSRGRGLMIEGIARLPLYGLSTPLGDLKRDLGMAGTDGSVATAFVSEPNEKMPQMRSRSTRHF